MRKLFFVFFLLFSITVFGQKDTVIKYNNSTKDSLRIDYRFRKVFKTTYYYSNGRIKSVSKNGGILFNRRGLKYNEIGKKIQKTKSKRNGKFIIITWVDGHRKKSVGWVDF